jgi:hypothetical protein
VAAAAADETHAMTGDVIIHRAHRLDDREGPLRILAAVEVGTDSDRAALVCKADGELLAVTLLHFLPRATLEHLLHTLIDATYDESRYVHGSQR